MKWKATLVMLAMALGTLAAADENYSVTVKEGTGETVHSVKWHALLGGIGGADATLVRARIGVGGRAAIERRDDEVLVSFCLRGSSKVKVNGVLVTYRGGGKEQVIFLDRVSGGRVTSTTSNESLQLPHPSLPAQTLTVEMHKTIFRSITSSSTVKLEFGAYSPGKRTLERTDQLGAAQLSSLKFLAGKLFDR